MPRSFLVKKQLTNKKPDYGELDSKKHEVIHIEPSSSKLKILHPHVTLFPAPCLGNSALSPTLQMNPINSGIYVPPQPPRLSMDGTFLGITYPRPVTSSSLRDMQPALPMLECTKPQSFQISQRDLQDNIPVLPLGLSTTGNSDECFDCQKAFLTLSTLANQRQIHCQWQCQKYFSCKYCDKEYVSLGALKMHIRTHTLPCVCKLCGKAFSRPWLLQGHIRTHTGEKPFSCPHCSRAFADRSNLRAHLQTHSEIKKYQCRSCFKTFSRISLLTKHEEAVCCPMT
ncbi:zinc finger protein SNAI2-like [Sinocyclocheilus anshuiensis]|uniref:Zinc finger protein SNAI2 n=1 Tax=Sinocyclocheilus anshuiensis TaxID=1608454 RepID=A0A671QXI8_9TELE|nr:PREDICTED: zinc finger protein SNAI2-like [Sinocyclocheilus anshuiensis]